uniref:X globin n=1 Tax=Astyanax mexicanus TaxID=7994 RepID=A0A8B9GMS8_ASTMX
MGCAISGLGLAPRQVTETRGEEETLSEEQISMIKESWKLIQEDIAKVGIIMFVRVISTSFQQSVNVVRCRSVVLFLCSVCRVMSFIEKSVARLDQLERLDMLAVELGKSHYRYNAPPKYYGYVGAEFICAVRPILKDKWTPELEKAWKTLFRYITRLMRQGYLEEEGAKRSVQVSTKERPDKRNTAL